MMRINSEDPRGTNPEGLQHNGNEGNCDDQPERTTC